VNKPAQLKQVTSWSSSEPFLISAGQLTGLLMRFLHVSGRKFPLAAGNTPISCSSGLNCTQQNHVYLVQNWFDIHKIYSNQPLQDMSGSKKILLNNLKYVKNALWLHQFSLYISSGAWVNFYNNLFWCAAVKHSTKTTSKTTGEERGNKKNRPTEKTEQVNLILTGLVSFSKSVNIPLISLKSEANGA